MLSLEEIKEQTVWVAHLYGGTRFTGTYKEVEYWKDSDDLDEFDIVCADGQPKELQPFYKAYEYANYHLGRHDLVLIDDFYAEWSKDPDKFTPQIQPVIGNLRDKLEIINSENNDASVLIMNYDENGIGNHSVQCWLKTLDELNENFDVIFVGEKFGYAYIQIQETNKEKVDRFDETANRNAWTALKY